MLAETFPARLRARRRACPTVERLAYLAEFARRCSSTGVAHLVLVDAKAPVSFFAYPGKPSDLVPDGCEVHVLAAVADDAVAALQTLAEAASRPTPTPAARRRVAPELPDRRR